MQLFQITLLTTALAIPAVSAFAPSSTTKGSSTTTTTTTTKLNAGKTYLNGWVPEDMTTKFCYGLPGTIVSFFINIIIYLYIYIYIILYSFHNAFKITSRYRRPPSSTTKFV
jgi:hypothetical protein